MVIAIENQINSIPFGRLFYFAFVPPRGSFVFLGRGFPVLVPSSCHTALVLECSTLFLCECANTSPGIGIGPAQGISAYLLLPDMITLFSGNL